ncbi:hypothetical protein [Fluviicola sp.]|jgi:hypothetical protein|uniref:hypothetical protein n=1 Tax=Fluviicola sp. TaxID=1917219 RepID=UPI0028248854|nr:hypothetical protein [Fluviicola sp.]MDR0801840.1 hypothetical protein [Fluviicola sp.]
MKSFWRRLRYYGLGFGIGLIFVFFFFRNRGCSWLPENRVKNTFLGRVLVISEDNQRIFNQHRLTDSMIVSFLNDGSVSFGSSKKQGNPKVYKISKKLNGKGVELWFSLPEGAFISEVLWPKGSIQQFKNTTSGLGRMVHFPNVENFVFLKDNPVLNGQRRKLGVKDEEYIQLLMKKNSLIDFAQSNLEAEPFPEQLVLLPRQQGDTLKARTVWFKEHIEFYRFEEK